MFGHRYFGARQFGPRYFGEGGGVTPIPPSSVDHQGDGKPHKKRRNRTKELFDRLEQTLHETMYGVPDVQMESIATVGTSQVDAGPAINAALRELTEASHGYSDLSARVALLRKQVAEYEARKRREDDDDDDFLLMGL